jgi:hypothetical protein
MNLPTYLRAGYPGLALISSEEARAEAEIASACTSLERKLHAWSSTEGLVDTAEGRATPCPDPLEALGLLDGMFASDTPRHVVLLRDLQLHLDQSDPMLVRRIKDTLRVAKANGHTLILLGCRLKLPPELEHEITQVDFNLPDPAQLATVLDGIAKSAKLKAKDLPDTTREATLQGALGLTTTEAENAFALSVVETAGIDPAVVREYQQTLSEPETKDVDELDRFRELPHCIDAVLGWLRLNRISPRRFYHHIGLRRHDAGHTPDGGTLDRLLLERIQEFQACLLELSLCLDVSFLGGDGLLVQERIERLDRQLQGELKALRPLPEGARSAARKRGNELLDGVYARKFSPGKINPHRLFRYAAERGITKLGRKGDQKLVAGISEVNGGAVVCPPIVFAAAGEDRE